MTSSGVACGDGRRINGYLALEEPSVGDWAGRAMAYALAVSEINASMGRIVATPTAGSCGIIPGVFVSSQERFGWEDERLVKGLFAAGAIGYVIANNSFISGIFGMNSIAIKRKPWEDIRRPLGKYSSLQTIL